MIAVKFWTGNTTGRGRGSDPPGEVNDLPKYQTPISYGTGDTHPSPP